MADLVRRDVTPGQHAESVCRQEHHVVRVASHAAEHRIGDEVDRIRGAGVLCLLVAVVIGNARARVVDDARGSCRSLVAVDLRSDPCGCGRLAAAAFEVEDPRSLQPCSSLPISRRDGSAERVVLPVPSGRRTARRPTRPARCWRSSASEDPLRRKEVVERGEDRL